MTSFLQSDEGRRIVEGRPVVTVSGNRNMWAMAQKKIDTLLIELGAVPVGNIASLMLLSVDVSFNVVLLGSEK